MATKSETSLQSKVTWSQKLTDFSVIVKSGEKLQVHRHILAENSDVFEAMLTKDMEESKTNEVQMDHFSEETVVSFLEYLYSDPLYSSKPSELIRASAVANKYIYKRSFDEDKLTMELLSMAHMYHVRDLEMDCIQRVKETISDDNVMDVWMEGERCKMETLCSIAIEHLVVRPSGKTLHDVSGFDEVFQDHDKPLKDLLDKLTEKNSHLQEEILQLKEKCKHHVERQFEIRVEGYHYDPVSGALSSLGWGAPFYVKANDKLASFLDRVEKFQPAGPGMQWALASSLRNSLRLELRQTRLAKKKPT